MHLFAIYLLYDCYAVIVPCLPLSSRNGRAAAYHILCDTLLVLVGQSKLHELRNSVYVCAGSACLACGWEFANDSCLSKYVLLLRNHAFLSWLIQACGAHFCCLAATFVVYLTAALGVQLTELCISSGQCRWWCPLPYSGILKWFPVVLRRSGFRHDASCDSLCIDIPVYCI